MLKVTRYLVLSDQEFIDHHGTRVRLLVSTRTGSMIPVEVSVAAALELGRVDDIPPDTVTALRAAEVLVPESQDELAHILAENVAAASDRSIAKFTLLPTSYCNMGCTYCGQQHSSARLGASHRDQVRARVLRRVALPSTRRVQIDWFGAEPMVGYAMIRDLSRDFVAIAAQRGLPYWSSIVTNGTLLTTKRIGVLIRECQIAHFEITLDGPPEVHDTHRPLKAGGGSFWKIVRTIQKAVVDSDYQSVTFQFRTNVDRKNHDRIEEYIALMGDLGFARRNVSFSIAPVHAWGNDVSDIEIAKRDYAELEVSWLRLLHRRGMRYALLPSRRRRLVCGAVTRATEYISSTGNIFSCSEFPLVPEAEREQSLGTVGQPGLPIFRPPGPFDDWNQAVAEGESWCRGCIFLPVCGGACPKSWQQGVPPCPSYKLNVQSRLGIAAARAGYLPSDVRVDAREGAR